MVAANLEVVQVSRGERNETRDCERKNHTKAMRFGPEFRSFISKDIIDTTVRSLDYESETP